jgi:hypothetical protein
MRLRDDTPPTPQGLRVALLFALTAHRLHGHYEHGQWLNDGQCAHLAADWLARSKNALPLAERRELAELSDSFARQLADTLSRELGLRTAHEMMEALDPRYQSELAESLLATCAELLAEPAATPQQTLPEK